MLEIAVQSNREGRETKQAAEQNRIGKSRNIVDERARPLVGFIILLRMMLLALMGDTYLHTGKHK